MPRGTDPGSAAQSAGRLSMISRPTTRQGWTPAAPPARAPTEVLSKAPTEVPTEVLDLGGGPGPPSVPPRRADRRGLPVQVARAALLAAVAVVLGALARGILADSGQVDVQTLPARGASGSIGAPSSPVPTDAASVPAGQVSGAPTPARVVVHVVGKVHRPSLVTLPSGARVADALASAGGPASGAAVSRINLARLVQDGEQVVIPGPNDPITAAPPPPTGPAGPAGPAGTPGQGGPSGAGGELIDLNTATEAQLDTLPGVGPVTAQRIVEWRRQHQRFSHVDELAEVDGIGPKTLERLRPLVRV